MDWLSSPTARDQNDSELIRRLRLRDPAAAGDLYDSYGCLLFSLMLNIVGDRQDTEDLLAELLLKASNRLQSFKADGFALRPWLLILARNHALRFRAAVDGRKERARRSDRLESLPLFRGRYAAANDTSGNAAAQKAFRSLPEIDRLILELAWFEGMSFEEISARIDLPIAEVASAAKASLARLREC